MVETAVVLRLDAVGWEMQQGLEEFYNMERDIEKQRGTETEYIRHRERNEKDQRLY